MSPRGNVQLSAKEFRSGKKKSMFRRWLSQFLHRIGTCCGRLHQPPDDFELKGQLLRRYTETPETFQKFLRERKLEVKLETEERIANMKFNTEFNPLKLFPTEIWLHILKDVETEGLANMLDIHNLFRDLILDKRNLVPDILLPVLLDFKLPIVRKHILPADPRYYRLAYKKDEVWPLITLRRVCKSFRDGIDRWIENRLLHLMRTSEFVERSEHSFAIKELNCYQLDTCHSWERLSKILEYSRGPVAKRPKRFIMRSLNIAFYCNSCYWDSDNSPRYDDFTNSHGRRLPERFHVFKDSITEFLQIVGDQIMHISFVLPSASRITFFGVPLSQVDIYEILREWLLLTTNLRWLQINASVVDALSDVTQEKNLAPMPTLRKLERFDFQGCVEEAPIWRSILSANPQISRINVLHSWPPGSSERYEALNKAEIDAYKDPAVLTLPLEVAHFGRRELLRWDFAVLTQIRDYNWNLKRLTLWMGFEKRVYSMNHIFRFLANFQALEDVEIHIKWHFRDVSIGDHFLLLPHLKHFKFEFRQGVKPRSVQDEDFFFSLMFLLECRNLESLVWLNEMHDPEPLRSRLEQRKESMMISFMGGFVDLCGSNIWEVFPKLRKIIVRNCLPEKKFRCGREYSVRKYQDRKLLWEKEMNWKDITIEHR